MKMENFIVVSGTKIAIVIRLLSVIICLFFTIRLQIREVQVKNGLRKLRVLLLAIGITLFHIHLISLYFLFDIVLSDIPQKSLNAFLQIANSTAFLLVSIFSFMIYHQQYSPASKKMHADYEKKLIRQGKSNMV